MAARFRPWRVPFNKATSLQLTNIMLLAWWTSMLVVHHDEYERSVSFGALNTLVPDIYWWAVGTSGLIVVCSLPMVRWWRQNVNHSYYTKTAGMIFSAAWWMFLAMIFFMETGPELGFGVHLALALGCIYESVQISRVGGTS